MAGQEAGALSETGVSASIMILLFGDMFVPAVPVLGKMDSRIRVHSGVRSAISIGCHSGTRNRPRTAVSAWARTGLGARFGSAGSNVVPMDLPALMPGVLHSAEPQWPIRHGVLRG